jgi:hypothetical protein
MRRALVVAMSRNGVIGRDNRCRGAFPRTSRSSSA